MTKIHHIFGGISGYELNGALDDSGVLTAQGQELLRKIGVDVEAEVSIGKTTIQNLVGLYNAWKIPKTPMDSETEIITGKFFKIPEDDVYLQKKYDALAKIYKMGIKIGKGTKIGENVILGLGVSIGRYCDISDNCELCIFSTVKDRVYLGKASFVGKDSEIESESRVMSRAVIAPRNIVKKNSIIAEGFVFNENRKYR